MDFNSKMVEKVRRRIYCDFEGKENRELVQNYFFSSEKPSALILFVYFSLIGHEKLNWMYLIWLNESIQIL